MLTIDSFSVKPEVVLYPRNVVRPYHHHALIYSRSRHPYIHCPCCGWPTDAEEVRILFSSVCLIDESSQCNDM